MGLGGVAVTSRVASDDIALSVHDVMDILGVSRSFAYEVMARVGLLRLATKCVRVRKSDLDRYLREHTTECDSKSSSEARSGMPADLPAGSSSGSRRGTRTSAKRGSSPTAGKGSSLIPRPTVRTKPRSKALPNAG